MTRFIAHRGSSAAYAEHMRAAYMQAVADGADGLECGAQLRTDGCARGVARPWPQRATVAPARGLTRVPTSA